jgi:GNAT superfamily N-acetyltransferase
LAFLAPLYLLAGLAVAGPILFHLIRRSPRGKQVFSSLMFLQPSPPTVTRRSRIDDWLLLLLRGVALLLIVLAFSRPFWRSPESQAANVAPGREIVLLIDTSASLRRSGVWDDVQRQLAERLADIAPADQLHLWAFSREVRPLLTGEEWLQIPAGERLARARERVLQLQPDWERTDIADALISAAEQLAAGASDSLAVREIWLISDLQEGAEWDALSGYHWPAEVVVQLFPVGTAAASGNVAVQVIDDERVQADQLRVRLTNPTGSGEQLFLLGWRNGQIEAGSSWSAIEEQRAVPVTIPAGQSLVVRAPPVPGGLEAPFLELLGDEHPFDNRAYIPRRALRERTIVWLGDETPESQELRLFLTPVFPPTSRRTVRIIDWLNEAPGSLPARTDLIICAVTPSQEQQRWLQELLAAGASVLYVARNDAQSAAVGTLLGTSAVNPVTAGSQRDYWMLGRVDFSHPLLKPFDDPRFADFTKLRCWQKYSIPLDELPEGQSCGSLKIALPLSWNGARGRAGCSGWLLRGAGVIVKWRCGRSFRRS